MDEIRKQFKLRMKELKISNVDMAAKIGRSPGALSSYFNGKGDLDFYNHCLLGRALYSDPIEYKEAMKKAVLELKRPENIKCAIEFASFHEYADLLETLINSAEKHANRELNVWAKVYSVHLEFLKKKICGLHLASTAMKLNIKDENEDILFFQKWMVASGNYTDNKFEAMTFLMDELEHLLPKVQNEFLQKTYATRFNLLCGNYNLFQNNLVTAREKYELVLHDSPSTLKKGHAYHGLGISYMYEDKEKSYTYMKEALNLFGLLNHQASIKNVQRTVNIVSNYHDDVEFYDYGISDEMSIEKAKRYMNNGDVETAKQMLDSVDIDGLNIVNKAFYDLYKGILDNNIDSLYRSVISFKQYNNKLYAILPCKELLKRGERLSAVQAAYGEIVEI